MTVRITHQEHPSSLAAGAVPLVGALPEPRRAKRAHVPNRTISTRPGSPAADETVLAFLLDIRSGRHLDRAGEYLAPCVRAHQGPPGLSRRSIDRTPEQYAAHVEEMRAATGPWSFEVTALAQVGDMIDARWRQVGRGRDPGPGAGWPVVQHGRGRYAVRHGRIAEYWIDVTEHVGPCAPTASACRGSDEEVSCRLRSPRRKRRQALQQAALRIGRGRPDVTGSGRCARASTAPWQELGEWWRSCHSPRDRMPRSVGLQDDRAREDGGTMRPDQTASHAWEELAAAAADVDGDGPPLAALAGVVAALEDAAGASLGSAHGEGLVVLQRRFARAHRLGAATVGADQVKQHLAALRSPAPVPTPAHGVGAVPMLAGMPAAAGWCRA